MTKQYDMLQSTETEMGEMSDAELEELYSWVDSFSFSKPKRNIARDFSDGVLVAEIIKDRQPNLVHMHNYTPANSIKQKTENWNLLQRKVFSKLNFELAKEVVRDIVNCKPGVIERILTMLRIKLNRAEWELQRHPPAQKKGYGRGENDKPEADQYVGSPGRGKGGASKGAKGQVKGQPGAPPPHGNIDRTPKEIISLDNLSTRPDYWPEQPKSKSRIIKNVSEADTVPRILYEEKAQECLAKDETIKILEAKVQRMEHLTHLKDIRIEDLQNRVEASRPTGGYRNTMNQINWKVCDHSTTQKPDHNKQLVSYKPGDNSYVDYYVYQDKVHISELKDGTIWKMKSRLQRLEHLLHLKDLHIDHLQEYLGKTTLRSK